MVLVENIIIWSFFQNFETECKTHFNNFIYCFLFIACILG